jgi:hypothetical protein
MKFVHYLEKISGVSIYPVLSFLIFSIFFLVVFVWVLKTDRKRMQEMSRIPLD